MKILVVHNSYQQGGGEDVVVEAERALLRVQGHEVVSYRRSNNDLKGKSAICALTAATETVWSFSSRTDLREIIEREQPNVAHFHNTFPLISPSAYYACAEMGVPVVQSLHNYRLLCPCATLLRDGQVCESCLGRAVPWPGVIHGCYRDSRSASFVTAAMLTTHRLMATWCNKVNQYIALTEFARGKFVAGGLPPEKISVKPNFVDSNSAPGVKPRDYSLFVGRLSVDKGPLLLPDAWRRLQTQIPLRIAGDGPLRETLRATIEHRAWAAGISEMGQCSAEMIHSLMEGARFLLVPSIWYECCPMTVLEAYSSGVPVIASRIGSLAEIVKDGVTGLHFNPGDAADLAAKIEWAWAHPDEMQVMGCAARLEYEAKYTPEANYKSLLEIYRRAIGPHSTAQVAAVKAAGV